MTLDLSMGFIMAICARIFVFLILFIGYKVNGEANPPVDYEVYVNQIVLSFAKEMAKEFGLVCIGEGGRMPHDVEEIAVKFIAYRKASINEARELEIIATERLLKIINNNEKIRPFLREYPFKANRAEVSISFNKPNNTSYTDGSVARVTQINNKIYYRGEDGRSELFYSLGEEPYEEALKIVQNKGKS